MTEQKMHLVDYVAELEQQVITLRKDKEKVEDKLMAVGMATQDTLKELLKVSVLKDKYEQLLHKAEEMIKDRDQEILRLKDQLDNSKIPWYGSNE